MSLKGRHFLTLKDFTPEEIQEFLDLAAQLKAKKKQGVPVDTLRGKNVALIFEKTSTRTRCSFEVAAHDLGMGTIWIPRAPRSGRRRALPTLPGCWEACMKVLSTGATARRLWRSWPSTPEFPSGTV